ncbi:hypothetical protein MRX96_058100 [Rhipicephalus microplus]
MFLAATSVASEIATRPDCKASNDHLGSCLKNWSLGHPVARVPLPIGERGVFEPTAESPEATLEHAGPLPRNEAGTAGSDASQSSAVSDEVLSISLLVWKAEDAF